MSHHLEHMFNTGFASSFICQENCTLGHGCTIFFFAWWNVNPFMSFDSPAPFPLLDRQLGASPCMAMLSVLCVYQLVIHCRRSCSRLFCLSWICLFLMTINFEITESLALALLILVCVIDSEQYKTAYGSHFF